VPGREDCRPLTISQYFLGDQAVSRLLNVPTIVQPVPSTLFNNPSSLKTRFPERFETASNGCDAATFAAPSLRSGGCALG
jgi:hypothetical protein